MKPLSNLFTTPGVHFSGVWAASEPTGLRTPRRQGVGKNQVPPFSGEGFQARRALSNRPASSLLATALTLLLTATPAAAFVSNILLAKQRTELTVGDIEKFEDNRALIRQMMGPEFFNGYTREKLNALIERLNGEKAKVADPKQQQALADLQEAAGDMINNFSVIDATGDGQICQNDVPGFIERSELSGFQKFMAGKVGVSKMQEMLGIDCRPATVVSQPPQ